MDIPPEAERHVVRLQEEYGDFTVEVEHITVSSVAFRDCMRAFERGQLGGSRVLVEHDGEHLLVREEIDSAWDIPGGSRDSNEAFEETARKAVKHATGITPNLVGVFGALVYVFEDDDGDRVGGVWALWDATADDPTLELNPEAISEARWFDDPPDDLAPHIAGRLGGHDEE
ncbi:NUDIX domain-containing protein [Halocalculus aciditolerans]|uniref:NUDIX hydrolase n=1 Tax=Halocalculus aciditolerans TaxID=1383812 RepID=A0A830FJQ9_9EURY|nr:NUDIX hydrolase [Halocalculus aciditolerans]GGL62267.1 NUDIX hydrolase [Halocalculus aciditolerans]